jgi:hypothetical protein
MTGKERADILVNAPIIKAVQRAAEVNMNILTVMFNTVFALAKSGKPMKDYELHMNLHVKNRKDLDRDYLDVGSNYQTEKSAKDFLMAITEQLRQDKASDLSEARFMSVLADGSTDSSITEQYTILVRYVNPKGLPVTIMASIVDVESANAEGILNGVKTGLSNMGQTMQGEGKPIIVGANFDGAAVMMGCKAGVSTLMKEEVPHSDNCPLLLFKFSILM